MILTEDIQNLTRRVLILTSLVRILTSSVGILNSSSGILNARVMAPARIRYWESQHSALGKGLQRNPCIST